MTANKAVEPDKGRAFRLSHGPFGANRDRLLSLFASKPSRSRPSFRRAKTKRGIQTP